MYRGSSSRSSLARFASGGWKGPRYGCMPWRLPTDIEGNEEFALANAALRRDDGAGAGREPHVGRSWLAPLSDAIRIPRENRTPELTLGDFRFQIADFRLIVDCRLDAVRDAFDVRRDVVPIVDRREQIRTRGRRPWREPTTPRADRSPLRA